MKTMHLFAGAGGGLLADRILGHDPIIAVEWNGYCCNVLRKRAAEGWFPNLQVWEGDVRLFNPSKYAGKVDCIHAGFPCQDISNAGSQDGIGEGTRSGLYREVLRIADIVRPKFIQLENVAAIVSGNNGEWLRTIIADLAKRGYLCKWRCISAADVGANHKRDRWWLLAYSKSDYSWRLSKRKAPAYTRFVFCRKDVAYSAGIIQQGQGKFSKWGGETKNREGETNKFKSECIGNFWSIEPRLGRVADGVADRMDRLKAIGNGQVPLTAALAWKLLSENI